MSKDIEDIYLLSPMQQGMLFHTLYDPRTQAYFSQSSWTLRADLNAAALQAAGQAVMDRHSILRSSCLWEGRAKPLQVVWRGVELPFEQLDWRAWPAAEQEERFESYLLEDQQRGFVLSQPPLMRQALIRLTEDTYKFVWSNHHLLLDGWSNFAVLKELLMTYAALCHGRRLQIEPARHFRDYITWLRQQDMAKAEAYWREYFRGISGPTLLDIASVRGNGRDAATGGGSSYSQYQVQLTPEATRALKAFAREHQLTLNTVVQGAWALLLSRYTSQGEVVFGSVVSGRPAALSGVEEMVGLFINTLPVRVKIDGKQQLVEWLRLLQARQAEMREYEYSPLVEVQRWSGLDSATPLFNTILVFENFPIDEMLRVRPGGLEISDIRSLERTSYPLTVSVGPGDERIILLASYEENRFDAEVIQQLVGHVRILLEGMAENPSQRLADIPLLTERERHQLLVEWNDTAQELHSETTLQRLFEEQVARTPDALAVTYEDEQLTYRELNERANQLAHHLQGLGVGADSLVGIMMERSLEMVVGLLGILKAGGAYVPLDPQYPQERLAFMLADADVRVLLTQQHLTARLPKHDAQVICLDSAWPEIEKRSTAPASSRITPDNLAYVIYTSGSTGRPKGAMNSHRAIANRLLWMQQRYGLTGADRVLQKTPISFDVSVWEFFWPLLVGARLVMARPGGHQDSAYLAEVISGEQVTTLHFVPAMLHYFLAEPGLAQRCASVRLVMSSGEALSAELVERCYERLPAAGLHNLYGPTEAAVDVTAWACPRGETGGVVPIGRPIANLQVYILDERLEPVPAGVAGELYLGGVGLARGYWRGAELTAEKFLPDPFGQPGGRLYRTGDLGRYLLAGEIEYLGRIDHQVKLRGFRIELGEIEAVLGEQETVRQCVVVAREEEGGEKRLVAYVVGHAGAEVEVSRLREQLRERLPGYMIPSAFVVLAELPLTPNGKVDRRRLPAPELSRDALAQPFIPPHTELERQIAALWSEVLQVEKVSIHDNFFDLGGHSLLLLQMHGKLREKLQSDLSLMEMFQFPTIHTLAGRLANQESAAGDNGKADADVLERLTEGKSRLRQQYQHRQVPIEA